MSKTSPVPDHPLIAAVGTVDAALDAVAGLDPLYLPIEDKRKLLGDLTRCVARLTGLRASLLAVADDLAAETGARSAGLWLAAETRTSRREAIHDQCLGAALRERWTLLSEAAASGA